MLDQLPDDFKDIIMDVMKDFFGDLRSHSKKRMNEIVADCIEDAAKNIIDKYVANHNFIDMILDFMDVNKDGIIHK